MKIFVKISTLFAFSIITLNANLITEFNNSNCSYRVNNDSQTICKNLGFYLEKAETKSNINRYIMLKYANLEINRLKLHNMNMGRLEEAIKKEISKKLPQDLAKIDQNNFMIVSYLHHDNSIEIQKKSVTIADLVLDYPDLAKRYHITMPQDKKELSIEENN